jgi:hypothetical protein
MSKIKTHLQKECKGVKWMEFIQNRYELRTSGLAATNFRVLVLYQAGSPPHQSVTPRQKSLHSHRSQTRLASNKNVTCVYECTYS